jgi:hypothetical protein
MSATYSGTDEFGVTNYIINLLSTGMETGAFVSEGSPALMVEFVTASEMSAGENSGIVVPIKTDRGTIWQVMQQVDEENVISKYGKLFVGLLVVLSVGFVISAVFKRKRKNKRDNQATEENAEDQNASPTVREEQISEESLPMKQVELSDEEEGEAKSVASGWTGMFGNFFAKEEPQSTVVEEKKERSESPLIDQVELDVPKNDSDEVEMTLATETKKGWW